MKNKLIAVLLAVMLVISAAGCATPLPEDLPEDLPQPAQDVPLAQDSNWPVQDQANIATRGEEYVPVIIYAYFFALYQANLQHHAMMTGQTDLEAFWGMEQDGVTIRQMLVDEAMRAAKEYTAFYRLGFAQGITESDEQAKHSDEQIAILLEQAEEDEDRFIETYRLTPEQLREAMRRVNVAAGYVAQSLEDIAATDEALREAYDADPDAFDQVTVRHVLIGVNDEMTEDERAAATALAYEILERINGGEAIGELAAQYSEDPGSADADGEYTFGVGMMVTEFEQWAFAATPGDTGVVLTQFGYHVMQLMSRTDFEDLDPSDLDEQARAIIFQENHQGIYDLIDEDDWVFDYELLDAFIASILQ